MSQGLPETPPMLDEDVIQRVQQAVKNLVTEDDEPVDNICSEKQQRLLTEALYNSWMPLTADNQPRPFWAAANVAIFPSLRQPPLVPDVFVSLDVTVPADWHETRSYFFWEYGKGPEVVIEIVSNLKGGEMGNKRLHYARIGITHYVVYDPQQLLTEEVLQVFVLQNGNYQRQSDTYMPVIGLGVTLWQGTFEDKEETYLRWCDVDSNLLLTGTESTQHEAERAEREAKRAELLAKKLRELGIDPDQL
jgi:Uma2 family endonuclease